MIIGIFIDEIKVLCDFLSFSDVAGSIMIDISVFNKRFRVDFWFLMVLWLRNIILFDNDAFLCFFNCRLCVFVGVNFADEVNALD